VRLHHEAGIGIPQLVLLRQPNEFRFLQLSHLLGHRTISDVEGGNALAAASKAAALGAVSWARRPVVDAALLRDELM
jgi:hypothetical protein